MIPFHIRISGFLSYHDTVELDFTNIDLACISGHNGAGKSSLLDAITWSLFGEARGKSSDVIHLRQDVKAAEVALTFQHEDNTYRVQRTLPRNKNTITAHRKNHAGDSGAYRANPAARFRYLCQRVLLPAGQSRSIHTAECHPPQGSIEQYSRSGNVGGIQEQDGGKKKSA
jgi:ATPase subunit of ABC transporter with duplicated ATPase domains